MSFVKSYIFIHLPNYKFIKEYNDSYGYWGAIISDKNVTIFLGSERGFLDYYFEIEGKKVELIEFDNNLTYLERSTKKISIIYLRPLDDT